MSNGLCEQRGNPADEHIHVVGLIEVFADGEDLIVVESPDLGEEVFEERNSCKEGEDPNDDDGPDDTDSAADKETEESGDGTRFLDLVAFADVLLDGTKDNRKDDRHDDEDDDCEDKSGNAVCEAIGNSRFRRNLRNAADDKSGDEWVSERKEARDLRCKNLILVVGDDESNFHAGMRRIHKRCAFIPS